MGDFACPIMKTVLKLTLIVAAIGMVSAQSCTSPTATETTVPAWTGNTKAYMCSQKSTTVPSAYSIADLSTAATEGFACCQISGDGSATCDCSNIGSSTTIQCFTYASMGQASGSCGDCATSMSDGGCTGDVPLAVANNCIGSASCDFTFTSTTAASTNAAGTTASAATVSYFTNTIATPSAVTTTTCDPGNVNNKIVAYCAASAATNTCAAPTAAPTGENSATSYRSSFGLLVLVTLFVNALIK